MFYVFSYLFFFLYCFLLFVFLFCFYVGGVLFDFYIFSVFGFDVYLTFVFDYLSLGFFSCVSLISGMVFYYSNFYMGGGLDLRRFSYLVFLFVASMFVLVFSGNFFLTMVGWDGLGLVSFCLVVFYSNSSSLDSGLITVFSNRVGDVFFLLSFFFFSLGGYWSFDFLSYGISSGFLLFLFLGAITKSAQVPFSAWLPAAMAAPTPVSSLVHSSTLVTAGVYVLIRYHYLFIFYGWFFKAFSLFTMLLAGLCACLEKDFKKVIAMSTLSQLGMMLFVLFIGSWVLSFLHMVIHAFFKSTLFLSSGMLISQGWGGQDSRFYGGFLWGGGTFLYFFVSCASLAGFPFVIGFYSKDLIISTALDLKGGLFFFGFVFGCFFTVFYSLRLFISGFVYRYKLTPQSSLVESGLFFFPVYLLFTVCCFSGGFLSWLILSDFSLFFRGLDLFMGVLIISFCLLFYSSLSFWYSISSYFMSISFLRWISTGGFSRFFRSMFFFRGDSSWMEVVGGRGSYNFVGGLGGYFYVFFKTGLKGLMVFMLVSSVLFFS